MFWFQEHLAKHAGDKPYKCEVCPKQFNHKTDLRRHMCLHTGEKPFACDVCGKGFIREDRMVKHSDTHKKKQPILMTWQPMSHNDNAGWSRPLRAGGGGVTGNGIESAAPSSSPWPPAPPPSSFAPSPGGPGGSVWRPDAAVRVAAHGLHWKKQSVPTLIHGVQKSPP